MKKILATTNSALPLILRIALGVVMLPHGLQKTFGWFGGYGFSATMNAMSAHYPAILVFLAIAAEFAGSLGLLTGFLTRIAAFGILCNMLVAIFGVHLKNGFFMNWTGKQVGEGFEFHVLVIAICVGLMICGGGRASVDRLITQGSSEA
ncbi:MAG TPA: DoxX family protein [Fimbriimonadaceae bacterium]|nr:DoxX family protein [Fimbriimonadaceae bacterium]